MGKSSRKKIKASEEVIAGKGGPESSQSLCEPGLQQSPPAYRTLYFKYYIAAAVSLITFIVYLSSLQLEFLNWDDPVYVYENPHIHSLDMTFFKWAFFDFHAANWHPLTWISHALDYALWGLNPLGHHLTNNIIHAVNTFLVVVLGVRLVEAGRKLTNNKISPNPSFPKRGTSASPPLEKGDRGGFSDNSVLIAAATTGLLFGLHPLHVESVAWVAERKDLLCALFFLLSILMYLKYAVTTILYSPLEKGDQGGCEAGIAEKSKKQPPPPPFLRGNNSTTLRQVLNKHYLLALFFFFLALLSKPMAVTLPVVLLILDWYPFKRIQSLKSFWSAFIEKLPFFALSLASSVLTIMAQRAEGALKSMEFAPLATRLLVAARSLLVYLWKIILPINLVPHYPYPKDVSFFSFEYFPAIVFAAGVTMACIIYAKKQKLFLSVWGYYVIALIPVIGIVQVGEQAMADRYTYLPSLGPFLIIGLGVAWVLTKVLAVKKRYLSYKLAAVSAVVFLVVSLTWMTFSQIGIWRNSFTLWNYVIEKQPIGVPQAYNNRGNAFFNIKQFDKAIENYDRAIALNPSFFEAYNNRAIAFNEMGQLDKAIEDCNIAIVLNPSSPVYYVRGKVFEKKDQIGKAIEDYNKAVALNSSNVEAYIKLGVLYGKSGSFDKSIEQFNKAVEISPDYPAAYNNRGYAYLLVGQTDKALEDYNQAIKLKKDYVVAYINRGNLYLKTGKKERAGSDFQKACELGDKEGCNSLQAVRSQ